MKRQYTKQVFWVSKAKGTYIKMYLIKNKTKGKPFDIIKVVIHSLTDHIEFNAGPEEAIELIWGLSKCLWGFLDNFKEYDKWRNKKL